MKLRALIFDVDGTLADTEEGHRRAFNAAFARHGHAWSWDPDTYRRLLEVSGGKERIAHFLRGLGLGPERLGALLTEVEALHGTKTSLYGHLIGSGDVPLRPGIARLVADARRSGVALAIATTTTPANVRSLVEAGFGPNAMAWFDAVVAGDMVAAKKPAPDAYLAVLDALELEPWQCVAFEDSRNGLLAAAAADLRTVVTPTAWTAGQDFSEAWRTLPSLGDPEQPLPLPARRGLHDAYLTLDDLDRALRDAA